MVSLLKKALKPIFKYVAHHGLMMPHGQYEIELFIAGIKPVLFIANVEATPELQALIKNGSIVHIGDNYKNRTDVYEQFFAQKNKIKDGREVYARVCKNGRGYPTLSEKEGAKRIGKLLGYTDNDIALATREKYQRSLTRKILRHTQNIRRWARKKYLLNYPDSMPK